MNLWLKVKVLATFLCARYALLPECVKMARPKLGESATERLHVKITADEIEAIDSWRYAHRIPSRSEAVRRLCQMGLRYDQQEPALVASLRAVADVMDSASKHWRAALEK